jgi:predicted transposase/invertase (TIGR01784 family)
MLLKSAFEETFPDLLRFFFTNADLIFDIDRGFVFMDKELGELFPELAKKGGSRIADMLVKTYLNNGVEEWILIHLEIQEKNDKHFAKRMFQYFYRIYDRYEVPVTALAAFTENNVKERSAYFQHDFLGTKIRFDYNSYHILDHSEQQLLDMNNPFALVILAAQKTLLQGKIPDQELGRQRLMIARSPIKSNRYSSEQIRRFLFFLKTFIHIENPEINFNFNQEIDLLTHNKNAMGIIETIKMLTREEGLNEGLREGAEKKSYEIVRNLLLNTDFEISKIASLSGVTEQFVTEVKAEIAKK